MTTASLLVALHGHEDEPEPLATRLSALASPARVVVTPRSSFATGRGPVWFRQDDDGPVEDDLVASLDALDALIGGAAADHGLDRRHVIVGGFSQGAAVALALALRSAGASEPLAGVFSVSGWLLHAEQVAYDAAGLAASGTKVLVVHGAADDVVPVQQGRSAARYLERDDVRVRYVELPGDHHLGQPAVDELATWLDAIS